MDSKTINVIYHCNDNYLEYLIPSIWSIIHNTDRCVHFHIINDFTCIDTVKKYFYENNIKVTLYTVSEQLLNELDVPAEYYRLLRKSVHVNLYELTKSEWSTEIDHTSPYGFYYILYPYLFTFNRHISLNCDTIALHDVGELFDIELGDHWFGARLDWSHKTFTRDDKEYMHYNPSVMVGDLYQYGSSMYDLFMSTLRNPTQAKFAMQYDWNIIFNNKIREIDRLWNVSVKKEYTNINNSKILHFNTIITDDRIRNTSAYSYYLTYRKMSKYDKLCFAEKL